MFYLSNLYAIDYLKDHSVTAAEFKIIYAGLDEDTVKVSTFILCYILYRFSHTLSEI